MSKLGFPEAFIADGEKGIASDPFKICLEENNCRLPPISPAKGTRHTRYGIVEVRSRSPRGVLHRVDASFVEQGIVTTAEEVWVLTIWNANSSRGRSG